LLRTEGLPRVARLRAARLSSLSPKVLLAISGAVVFSVSTALGVALGSDEDDGASPNPASTPWATVSSPATEQPTTEPPSPGSSVPVRDDGSDAEEAKKEAEEERKAAEEARKRQEEERKKQAEERKGAAEETREDDD
jgi:hypothetical protein